MTRPSTDVLADDGDLLDQLRALRAEQRTLDERLARLEAERAGVSVVVFERVRRDYESRLAALGERARALGEGLRAARAQVGARLAEATAALQARRHDEEELRLRGRLGELDGAELAARLAALGPSSGALRAELAAAEEAWSLLESAPASGAAAPAPPAVPQAPPPPAAPPAPAPEPPPPPAPPSPAPPPPAATAPAPPPPATPALPPPATPVTPQPAAPASPPAPAGRGAGLTTAIDVAPLPPPASSQATMLMSAAMPPGAAGATQIFRPAVLVSERPIDGRTELPVEPLTTLGRGARNQIRLQETAVSTRHAEIQLTAEGYRLRDLKSTNGTFVNGAQVDEVVLAHGDRIVIGTFALDFRLPETGS